MFSTFLIAATLFGSQPLATEGYEFSRKGEYEASEQILKKVSSPPDRNEYEFFRLLNNFSLNDKKAALTHEIWRTRSMRTNCRPATGCWPG